MLIQFQILEHDFDQSFDVVVNLCNGLTTKLLNTILEDERDSNEG